MALVFLKLILFSTLGFFRYMLRAFLYVLCVVEHSVFHHDFALEGLFFACLISRVSSAALITISQKSLKLLSRSSLSLLLCVLI